MSKPASVKRLAVVASHPVQYHAPLYRRLAEQVDLEVFYAHRATSDDQAKAGFGVGFDWDVDLLSGYRSTFLRNVAANSGVSYFRGCDTPDIGTCLEAGRFDAVLIQGWYLKCFLQAAFAGKRRGIPVLSRGDSHLDSPRSAFKRRRASSTAATKAASRPSTARCASTTATSAIPWSIAGISG